MTFAMVVFGGVVKATEEVICGDPAIQTFSFAGYYLDVEITVGELKLGIFGDVGAYFGEQLGALDVRQ
jgi:hypothetical protein